MSEILDWLADEARGFQEVTPLEFYRDIFPEGELDEEGAFTPGKFVGIIVEVTKKKKKKVLRDGSVREVPLCKRYSVTDELSKVVEVASGDNFCVMAPLSYAGKERTAENARYLYAMVFDLDGIIIKDGFARGLHDFWYGHVMAAERLPQPTYIVSSGTGVHLYYVFEDPIALYRNVIRQLQKYKKEMTALLWNEGITTLSDNIQQEGIYQAFRMPGTVTKNGSRVKAFKCGHKVTVEYMNRFVFKEFALTLTEAAYKQHLSLEQAKKLYPDWYEQRIVHGQPRKKWAVSRNVYDWWKRTIRTEAKVGHRYYCLMMLAIYAQKCSIYDEKKNPNPVTREELEEDCFELMELFDKLTTDPSKRFDEIDVQDALEAFEEKYITYPRNSVGYRAKIIIPKNKRNGRKQKTHLQIARGQKKNLKDVGELKREGRPPKANIVLKYLKEHPGVSGLQAARELQVDPKTIRKYRKMMETEPEKASETVDYYVAMENVAEMQRRLKMYYDGYHGEEF